MKKNFGLIRKIAKNREAKVSFATFFFLLVLWSAFFDGNTVPWMSWTALIILVVYICVHTRSPKDWGKIMLGLLPFEDAIPSKN